MTDRAFEAKTDESKQWLDACVATRRALVQGQMMTHWSVVLIDQMRESLRCADPQAIAQHASNMVGPVSPMIPGRWLSDLPVSANLAGTMVLQAIIEALIHKRGQDEFLDVEEVKQACLRWIECGRVPGADDGCAANGIGAVIERSARVERGSALHARLVVLAPLAPAVEAMVFVRGLDEGFLDSMRQSQAHFSESAKS